MTRPSIVILATAALALGACTDGDQSKVRKLEMQLATATANAGDLEKQLATAQAEIAMLRAQLAELDTQAANYAELVADLNAQLEAAVAASMQLADAIAARDARDQRNADNLNIARGQYYGLTSNRYLSVRNYSFAWQPGELTTSKPNVGPELGGAFRVPLALSDEAVADNGDWKGERFTGELAVTAEQSETGRVYGVADTAFVYSKDLAETDSYLYFGWWQRRRTGDEPRVYFNAAPSGAVGVAPSQGIAALTGTATYAGRAAGRVGIYNPVGGHNWGSSFTAAATLAVDFGTGEPGTGRVSGTVDDFTVRGEGRDWTVTLFETVLNDRTGTARNLSGGTQWKGLPDPGRCGGSCWWGAVFHGGDADGMPQGVTGAFRTEHRNVGRMVGTFGATKD